MVYNVFKFGDEAGLAAAKVAFEHPQLIGKARCLITSPPYFGMRNYGGGEWEIGQEKTLGEYVENVAHALVMVDSLLAPEATMWINIGDVYIDKSPQGVHWRLANVMRERNWTIRQEIIWHKPKVMPESVKNRCTRAHEYLMVFARAHVDNYFWNPEGMKEPGVIPAGTKGAKGSVRRSTTAKVNSRPPRYHVYTGFRNRRSVWSVNPKPFPGAHFATYPPDLIRPIIATCSEEGDYVLDPFLGTGTTAQVANELGRSCIGLELNPSFAEFVKQRLSGV